MESVDLEVRSYHPISVSVHSSLLTHHSLRASPPPQNLNSMMRVFGAMMTRLGVPIPTQIGASTLIAAQEICKNDGLMKDTVLGRISELKLGSAGITGKTDRQEGVFYRLL